MRPINGARNISTPIMKVTQQLPACCEYDACTEVSFSQWVVSGLHMHVAECCA
jgi:hypothetical protein